MTQLEAALEQIARLLDIRAREAYIVSARNYELWQETETVADEARRFLLHASRTQRAS